ncbi:MAG: hypothetical protein A4E57_02864 [Syntrophorhabdaceae bacterium PtaU1.Bin034]|jgi:uncharacterized protein YprB with RNaseH-like and TPR domain|nr:MAG: hypothetical protein A4E57_02864 [Syntrophorhabdaceae bacterium PtaU1.Bin034]
MKSLEIISVRTPVSLDPHVKEDLCAICREVKESHEAEADVYTSGDVPGDLAVILLWRGISLKGEKSKLGQMLSTALKRFGLVDHVVWVTTEKG